MIIPAEGTNNKLMYCVRQRSPNVPSFEISPCFIMDGLPLAAPDQLFTTYVEACNKQSEYEDLYRKDFDHVPYVSLRFLKEHKDDLIEIQNRINSILSESANFAGVVFYDKGSEGFKIKALNKAIDGYYYTQSPNIKKDFSNIDGIVKSFVQLWNQYDNDDDVESFLRFVNAGQKYGWD